MQGGNSSLIWLGVENFGNGVYTSDHLPVDYTNWAPGQSENMYGTVFIAPGGLWYIGFDGYSLFAMCKVAAKNNTRN